MVTHFIIVTIVIVIIFIYASHLLDLSFKEYEHKPSLKFTIFIMYIVILLSCCIILYIVWYGYIHPEMTIDEITNTLI